MGDGKVQVEMCGYFVYPKILKAFYNLLQTYYACGERLWELDLENKRWLEGPLVGAGITWHNLGPNLVGLGYHSAFAIADIWVDGVESIVEYQRVPYNRSGNSLATGKFLKSLNVFINWEKEIIISFNLGG